MLAALAISRNIEYQTGVRIKKFVKLMRPLRSAIVNINGRDFLVSPEVSDEVKSVLQRLNSGH